MFSRAIKKLSSFSVKLLVFLIIVYALVLSAIRTFAPMADQYREEIALQLQQLINRPVEIETFSVELNGIYPELHFKDVNIFEPEGKERLLNVGTLNIQVRPFRSIVKRQFVPRQIILASSEFSLLRNEQGEIGLKGVDTTDTDNKTLQSLDLFTGLSITMQDIKISWQDDIFEKNYQGIAEELQVRVASQGIDVAGKLALDDSTGGGTVEFAVKSEGSLDKLVLNNGQFYTKIAGLPVNNLPTDQISFIPEFSDGHISLTSWGEWDELDRLSMQGRLGMQGFEAEWPDHKTSVDMDIKGLETVFQIQRESDRWQVDLNDLFFTQVDNTQSTKNGLSMAASLGDDFTLSGAIDRFSLDLLTRYQHLFIDHVDPSFFDYIDALNMYGELEDIQFHTEKRVDNHFDYSVEGSVNAMGWNEYNAIPGINSINAEFSFTQDAGQITLDSLTNTFTKKDIFTDPINLDSLNAELAWQKNDHNVIAVDIKSATIVTPDVEMVASGYAKLSSSSDSSLSLEVRAPAVGIDRVNTYLPLGIMEDNLANWLSNAFIEGQASNLYFSYDGALTGHALQSQQAHLHASFDAVDATVAVDSKWPVISDADVHAEFDDLGFVIDVSRAKTNDTEVTDGRVWLQSYERPEIEFSAKSEQKIEDYLAYLNKSDLKDFAEKNLSLLDMRGDTDLDLYVSIPLSRSLNKKTAAKGQLRFKNTDLSIVGADITINNIQGELAFTDDGVEAENINANYLGKPADIRLDSDKESMNVYFDTTQDVAALLPDSVKELSNALSGKSTWSGHIKLPKNADTFDPLLTIRSDLQGVVVDAPEPLNKLSHEKDVLTIKWPLDQQNQQVTFTSDSGFYLGFLKDKIEQGFTGLIGVGETVKTAVMPENGIDIMADLKQFELSSWLDFWESIQPQSDGNSGTSLNQLQFTFIDGEALGLLVKNGTAKATIEDEYINVSVEADDVLGTIKVPNDFSSGFPLVATFDTLRYETAANPVETETKNTDPATLPPLQLVVDNFIFKDLPLGKLNVVAQPSIQGLRFDAIEVANEVNQLTMSGDWSRFSGSDSVRLDIDYKSQNFGQTLSGLRLTEKLKKGSADIQGYIGWDGGLSDFDLNNIAGELGVNIKSGVVADINPGIGTLFSLLSIERLPIRLKDGFNDLESEGLYFDRFSGRILVEEEGVARFQDTVLRSPVAEIRFSGDTKFVEKQHAISVLMIPKLSSTLPIAAGLIATPQIGALTFIVDKLAKKAGVDPDRLLSQRYTIKGSWDAPEITDEK